MREGVQGRIFGYLLNGVVSALKNHSTVKLPRLPRMSDFITWATAAEPGLGLPDGSILAAFERCQIEQSGEVTESQIANTIKRACEEGYTGTPTELANKLALGLTATKVGNLQRHVLTRSHDETADLAVKVFELSQTRRQHWLTADYATKRRILEIVLLNCQLDGTTLCPTIRKPFDVLAEGLVSEKSRGDWPSFERVVATLVDIAISTGADSILATQVAQVAGNTGQSPQSPFLAS